MYGNAYVGMDACICVCECQAYTVIVWDCAVGMWGCVWVAGAFQLLGKLLPALRLQQAVAVAPAEAFALPACLRTRCADTLTHMHHRGQAQLMCRIGLA